MEYRDFLEKKSQSSGNFGFEATFVPDYLFDFQKYLVEWSVKKGRGAIFADCGLGKTIIELVWAENVTRKTNKRILILTPLAVSHQTLNESHKFRIECHRSRNGELYNGIIISNYEQLHKFNPSDFVGMVCDESSILKSFDGATKKSITEFMKKLPYRLLATATAAPNDYIELGTSSEALGELGHIDMLNRFFKNDQNNSSTHRHYGECVKWRFKGHAEKPFWRWVASWAIALRRPSDLGFNDNGFILPDFIEKEHLVEIKEPAPGYLFTLPAIGLKEQRDERRRTLEERCGWVETVVKDTGKPALVWCHLNPEGDRLEEIIKDSVQISGRDSDESKEKKFIDFINGNIRVLITKPKIGAWGLNLQHCAHITFFPSHSYEQYYQGVRRCWRFGQKNPVIVDIITTEGEKLIMKNLKRKAEAADKMFTSLVAEMNQATKINRNSSIFDKKEEVPAWL
ncbi:DEAD/DEAH box helicase [Neomegalonema sp.]|uniref:DEAD/DEAH box helicase n=1 Tax=Neomegalonema sp. TaxID=2039713 RepID=UPI00261775CA|nr:DEAD/DEAH box helicase [Neomegalonema sp.]MDD2869621.1 DEAD/DEAH box helicase [Neomegalonema sp.]